MVNGKLLVPEIVMFDSDDNAEFLITKAIPGEMVCSDYYIKNPDLAIKIIQEAFDNLYNVDISNCPFDVSNNYKLSLVEKNVKDGLVKDEDLKEENFKKNMVIQKFITIS